MLALLVLGRVFQTLNIKHSRTKMTLRLLIHFQSKINSYLHLDAIFTLEINSQYYCRNDNSTHMDKRSCFFMHNKDHTFLTTVSLGPSILPLSSHHHEQIPKSTKQNKHAKVIKHPVPEQHSSRDILDLPLCMHFQKSPSLISYSHVRKRRQVNVEKI